MAAIGCTRACPTSRARRTTSSVTVGESGYEIRNSIGPTVSLRMNDRWTANLMAGPMWCRSTNDFDTGIQCRGYLIYRKLVSCEALFFAAPPSAEYRAGGGTWQTSFYAGLGVHGRPAGNIMIGEVVAGAVWVLAIVGLVISWSNE